MGTSGTHCCISMFCSSRRYSRMLSSSRMCRTSSPASRRRTAGSMLPALLAEAISAVERRTSLRSGVVDRRTRDHGIPQDRAHAASWSGSIRQSAPSRLKVVSVSSRLPRISPRSLSESCSGRPCPNPAVFAQTGSDVDTGYRVSAYAVADTAMPPSHRRYLDSIRQSFPELLRFARGLTGISSVSYGTTTGRCWTCSAPASGGWTTSSTEAPRSKSSGALSSSFRLKA